MPQTSAVAQRRYGRDPRRDMAFAVAISLAAHVPLLLVRWQQHGDAPPMREITARLIIEPDPVAPPPPPRPASRSDAARTGEPPPQALPRASTPLPGEFVAPALPAAPEPRAAPRIDLDAAFASARRYGRSGRAPTVPSLQEAPVVEAPNPVGDAIRRSQKANCREAYAGWGLLGIPLLAYDGIAEKNCKW